LFVPNPLEFTDESDSYAVFGEVTRSFLDDRFELIGGIRYFEDTVLTTEQSTLANGTAGPFIAPRESNFDAVTWRVVAAYHPSEDQTLYASAATGFRSGFNQAATSLAAEPTLPDIKPDELLTYEFGFKGESSNGRLFFDTAVYYTEWNDTQQFRPTALRTAAVVNAEAVSGFGVDASISARPTDNLTLNANLGWNSLEFEADTFLTNPSGTFVLLPEGERMNFSPELTIGVGAEYTFPLGGDGLEGFIAGDARYTSHVVNYDVIADIPLQRVYDDIYDTNLRVGMQSENWTLTAFAENVLNENGALGPFGGQPLPAAARQRPRTIGIQLTLTN
jgi:iron complex outermembrane recepter protein